MATRNPRPHDFAAIRIAAERGTRGGGPFPHRAEIQRSFGRHAVDHVRASTDSHAAAAALSIGARAFAIGERVAFGGPPDLRTAAHEAAHVVQQRAGVHVKDGLGGTDDRYERQADAVADRVVQGRSAGSLLDQMGPARPGATTAPAPVVQRTPIPTDYGTFDTTRYVDIVGPLSDKDGVDIVLTFNPDPAKVNAEKIALVQTHRAQIAGAAVALGPSRRARIVPTGSGGAEGREIDRSTAHQLGNPLFATGPPGPHDKLGDTATVAAWGQHGSNFTDSAGHHHDLAILKDDPQLPGSGNDAGQTFETAALAVQGAQDGTYMGSVSWGWNVDHDGKFTRLPLSLVSPGRPSTEFSVAAGRWNKSTTAGTIKTIPDPTNVYGPSQTGGSDPVVVFTVAKDTEVTITKGPIAWKDILYTPVQIGTGRQARSGLIRTADLRDAGGGKAVIKLPIP